VLRSVIRSPADTATAVADVQLLFPPVTVHVNPEATLLIITANAKLFPPPAATFELNLTLRFDTDPATGTGTDL
jgi:hypothetical protein